MGEYIIKRTAAKCRLHQEIVAKARDELAKSGYFHKTAVVEALGYSQVVSDSVNWDFVRYFINYGIVCEAVNGGENVDDHSDTVLMVPLVPVSQRFFNTAADEISKDSAIRRYMTGGKGKKTAGYVASTYDNGQFAAIKMDQFRERIEGLQKARDGFSTSHAIAKATQASLGHH